MMLSKWFLEFQLLKRLLVIVLSSVFVLPGADAPCWTCTEDPWTWRVRDRKVRSEIKQKTLSSVIQFRLLEKRSSMPPKREQPESRNGKG